MKKGRLEAFSDGVLAIIITIMVLELKAPEDTSLQALVPVIPVFFSYILSFIYVAIYWINHHHLFQATQQVNAAVLWANMHLLFWLSLIPFTTSWMGENHIESIPVAFYGGVLFMSAMAFRVLEITLIRSHDEKMPIVEVVSHGWKEKLSACIYFVAIPMAFFYIPVSIACYVSIALLWTIPSRKLEKAIRED